MMKKIVFYGGILCILAHASLHWNQARATFPANEAHNSDRVDFFNTQFLAQYTLVTRTLKRNGFSEGFFTTSDNHSINYLVLERPHAECNVICCSGWYPGRKEGLASFYALLPETCNILFFDARGHGKSDGSLLSGLWQYGKHEYKDIIGAIEFLHTKNGKPIIIYGICAGAFNASHALMKLEQEKRLEQLNLKGFIFDSGWTSMTTTSLSAPQAHIDAGIVNVLSKIYGTKNKKDLSNKLPFKIISTTLKGVMKVIHFLFFERTFVKNGKETDLDNKMATLTTPILFIHSDDDTYIPIQKVKDIADTVKNKMCWWIKLPSKHACHHLKYKQEYQNQLLSFIKTALQTKQPST